MNQLASNSDSSVLQDRHCATITNSMSESDNHKDLAQWLVDVANNRDKQAFTRLFKFFAPKILRISLSKFNDKSLASEVVQETMSNVWRKAHLYHASKGAPTTWVYTIMRNVTFDMFRKIKSKREDMLSDDIWPLVEAQEVDEHDFQDHLQKSQLSQIVKTLPQNQQQVIKGFYFMEMSQEQLAEHLNLPLGTVKSRLRLALNKLKLKIGDHND